MVQCACIYMFSADAFVQSNLSVIQTYIHTLMALDAMQGANQQFGGSVSCPRILQHADQGN